MNEPDIKVRAAGRWKGILSGLGMDRKALSGKHGPCPICADGTDRFRFDDKEGRGTFICSHCGAGNGVDLVMKWKRVDFLGAKEMIEQHIGAAPVEAPKAARDDGKDKAWMTALWKRARGLDGKDVASRYLSSRGVTEPPTASAVRWIDDLTVSSGDRCTFPAMLSKFVAPDGLSAHLHRIYLQEPGVHADVDSPKMFMPGSVPAGGAVRTGPVTETMGIAEGLVNALSAAQENEITVWAALDANRLMKWIPPAGAKHIVIFADLDSSFTGQMAAYNLAFRLRSLWIDEAKTERYSVEVRFTRFTDDGQTDEDFNDILERKDAA